jgi:hypothetical protein
MPVADHPVRVVVTDDLERSRLTVAFRLILAIPHLIWLFLWTIATFFVAIVNWFITLFAGRPSTGLHGFLSAYLRYATHFYAYLLLAANPYPGFAGDRGYPVDLDLPAPEPQSRWKTAFRIVLALPALLLASVLISTPGGGGGRGGGEDVGTYVGASAGGVAFVVAFFGWFACLARGRMPQGFRDVVAYCLRYAAQAYAYLLLMTERYPDSDPAEPRTPGTPPPQAIRLSVGDDLRRSRLTVFFRLLLAFPHLVWLILWGIAVIVVALLNWFATLATGRPPRVFHRFLSAYLRYDTHVFAFLTLVANPFPGFTGAKGSYPVDLEIEGPGPQHRLKTLFRIVLAIPAIVLAGSLNALLFLVAVFGWFVSLATARMPHGLRNAGAYVLRYEAQMYGYGYYLLTDRYPYSGPRADVEEAPPELAAPSRA